MRVTIISVVEDVIFEDVFVEEVIAATAEFIKAVHETEIIDATVEVEAAIEAVEVVLFLGLLAGSLISLLFHAVAAVVVLCHSGDGTNHYQRRHYSQ